MNKIRYAFLTAVILVIMLVCSGNGITQGADDSKNDRVIYEQPMSYEDALRMKKKVKQSKKEKSENQSMPMNPLSEAISGDYAENSQMLKMLKAVLTAMGIEELPEGMESKSDEDKSNTGTKGNFKKWEDRHKWKGMSTEQR